MEMNVKTIWYFENLEVTIPSTHMIDQKQLENVGNVSNIWVA